MRPDSWSIELHHSALSNVEIHWTRGLTTKDLNIKPCLYSNQNSEYFFDQKRHLSLKLKAWKTPLSHKMHAWLVFSYFYAPFTYITTDAYIPTTNHVGKWKHLDVKMSIKAEKYLIMYIENLVYLVVLYALHWHYIDQVPWCLWCQYGTKVLGNEMKLTVQQ